MKTALFLSVLFSAQPPHLLSFPCWIQVYVHSHLGLSPLVLQWTLAIICPILSPSLSLSSRSQFSLPAHKWVVIFFHIQLMQPSVVTSEVFEAQHLAQPHLPSLSEEPEAAGSDPSRQHHLPWAGLLQLHTQGSSRPGWMCLWAT